MATPLLPPRAADDQSPRFIGIDLGKNQSQLSVLTADGVELANTRFDTTVERVLDLAAVLTPFDQVVLEVTTNSFTIARHLLVSGARVVISNPIKTRIIAESCVKTDTIDARTLAELLRINYIPTVWLPDPDTQQLRQLMSDRQSIVDRRTELKNRVHSVLHRTLVGLPGSDLFTPAGRARLRAISVPTAKEALEREPRLDAFDRFRLVRTLEEIERIDCDIAEVETRIAAFIAQREPLQHRLDHLLSIPGVSLVVGAGLLAAIGDVTRFGSAKKMASYFGLVPSTSQSGDQKAYHGRITKRGRSQGRWLAIEAAEHLRKSPGPLRALYTRVERKRGHNVAVVAVARKLVELVWHLLKKDEDYLYQVPSRTMDKRARVRQLARALGVQTTSASPSAEGRGVLYGTGLKGKRIRTQIARSASTAAEALYTEMVARRATEPSRRPEPPSAFNPLNPRLIDWQRVLEAFAAGLAAEHRDAEPDPAPKTNTAKA